MNIKMNEEWFQEKRIRTMYFQVCYVVKEVVKD